MLTYSQALELLDKFGARKNWKRPILPLAGSNRSMTYVDSGVFYHVEKDTGERIACPNSPGYVNTVFESPCGHRPTFAEPSIDIVYHHTSIATIHPDNAITVMTGGWYSVNTRARIEDVLGYVNISGPLRRNMGDFNFGKYSRSPCVGGPWIIAYPGGKVEFKDGITFNSECLPVDHTT